MSPGAVAVEAWGSQDLWDREYVDAAIPSSFRTAPSRAFAHLRATLGDLARSRVLDLGAGTGRHAIDLASRGAIVHAVDVSATACEHHREAVAAHCLTDRVTIEQAAIGLSALPDCRYDLIIDSYATCHLLSAEARLNLLDALLGCLTTGGRLYTAGMGDRDAYYARHRVPASGGCVSVDPLNGIAKLLQARGVTAGDAQLGWTLASATEHFTDVVAGTTEQREVHAAVLTR